MTVLEKLYLEPHTVKKWDRGMYANTTKHCIELEVKTVKTLRKDKMGISKYNPFEKETA